MMLLRLMRKVSRLSTLVASEIEEREIFQYFSESTRKSRELTALLKLRKRTSSTLVINMVVSAG